MPDLPLLDRIPWITVIVVAIMVVALALVIWLVVRWWRQRDAAPRPSPQPALARQLAEVWLPFYRDLPLRARHFPTVIVMGDAGAGKSHLIDARARWRSQANQFFPSAVDSPQLQLYLGSDVVVHELSAPLLRDIGRATRRALVRLWRRLGARAIVVLVVDARALSTTPPETLRELAELVRGKIGAFPARCRAAVEVRVCLSHMDQIEGYDELVTVLGAHHGAFDIAALTERLPDEGMLRFAAQALIAKYDANLAYGLAHRTSDAFVRLVDFYAAFPVLLTRLAPLLRSLTGDDPDQPHYRPSGLYLGSVDPDSRVGDPFVVDRSLAASSIAHQRQRHRRAALAVALGGVTVVGALMAWHQARVATAEQAIASYRELDKSAAGAGESSARRVSDEIARMHHGERLWLGHSFVERKRELQDGFAKALRDRYLQPLLKVQTVNRSTMLYVVALLYASEANGLRALVRDNLGLWVSKIGVSSTVVTAYLDVSDEQYQTAEPFDPQYVGSDWQSYVFGRIKPLYDQPQRLSQAQLDALNRDPPQLYDEREYAVRARVVELLSAQLALATHPPIAKLLASPLGESEWIETHAVALRGMAAAVANQQLAKASPGTLGELSADLEHMLAVPASHGAVFRVSRVEGGRTESFELDDKIWTRKLALSSAAALIAAVHDPYLDKPEQAIAFFPADNTLRETTADKYTAVAFARQVAPALSFITDRVGGLGLAKDEQAALETMYREQIEAYAEQYASALRAEYDSFRFDAGSEQALPFALTALVQPSSRFTRFLAAISTNATPALGDGPYYAIMAESLAGFRPLADLLAPAKGTIPGLAPYQHLISELAAALDPTAPGAAGATGAPTTLASSLSLTGALTLNKLTGADKDRVAQISGWLTGANVDRSLQGPFLAPAEAVYAFGTSEINRAIRQAWTSELAPLIAPLLARFPFRVNARSDVTVAELVAVLRAQGKQPGSFWASFQRWLGPVTVQRGDRYQWISGVTAAADALATINDLARLSRTLWDGDGNPSALPIEIIPQPLDAGPAGGRVPTLACLRSGAGAVYAFNQRPGASTFQLRWWEQGVSSVLLKMSNPSTAEVVTYSIDESESPFSFFRLLCRARNPSVQRTPATGACEPGRGTRAWDIPVGGSSTRSVTLTLETDPWTVFQIGR